jgi:hypothetical protein
MCCCSGRTFDITIDIDDEYSDAILDVLNITSQELDNSYEKAMEEVT